MSTVLVRGKVVLPVIGILLGLSSCLATAQSDEFKLPAGCKLPFAAIATTPDPFQKCGNCGVVSTNPKDTAESKAAKALQSQAKNDFCANMSSVTTIDFAALRAMQATSKKNNWVITDLPKRDVLRGFFKLNGEDIGEGSVVRLEAWVLDAHVSDCPTGESVNCEQPGFSSNDIHIPLLDPEAAGGRTQDECASATAEMSPHFRPAAWSEVDMKTPVKNVVRVTGPLFFDNAHKPCAGLTKAAGDAAPFRSSLWEVHPVYQFEVCANTDPTKCDVNSDSSAVWIPYDQWVKKAGPQATQPTGEKTRSEGKCKTPGPPATGNVPAQCPGK